MGDRMTQGHHPRPYFPGGISLGALALGATAVTATVFWLEASVFSKKYQYNASAPKITIMNTALLATTFALAHRITKNTASRTLSRSTQCVHMNTLA